MIQALGISVYSAIDGVENNNPIIYVNIISASELSHTQRERHAIIYLILVNGIAVILMALQAYPSKKLTWYCGN